MGIIEIEVRGDCGLRKQQHRNEHCRADEL
jgi:hypothetical protein